MQRPDYLARSPGEKPLAPVTEAMPRVIVCSNRSQAVEDGNAKAGDVILADTLAKITQPVSIVGHVRFWALYPTYSPGGDNKPVWVKLDSPEVRAMPECRWDGDEKPQAAECLRLVLYSPEIGLRVLVCQRTAVKAAVAVLRAIDQLGSVIYGPLWQLASEKIGKTYVPKFTHVGFVPEETARHIADAETEINALLAL